MAVKIRRPGIVAQVRADLRLLRRLVGVLQVFVPALRRQHPLELIDELSAQLLLEIDLEHEARNVRRLADALKNQPQLWMPRVIEPYVNPNVLVQEYSHGRPVSATFGTERGRQLAESSPGCLPVSAVRRRRLSRRSASGQPVRHAGWHTLLP